MNKYKQILLLYLRNSSFVLISGIFLLTAIVSKYLFLVKQPAFAEDFMTMLFVTTLWLTLHIGIIIKKQFASHRASLLPHYRMPHLHCAFLAYLFFVMIAIYWKYGLVPLFVKPQGMWGIYVSCLLVAVIITYIGYLSIGRVLIYGYGLLLILALESSVVISKFERMPYIDDIIAGFCLVLIITFGRRLLKLSEENFEYGYFLSWPPQKNFMNQLRANRNLFDFFLPVKNLLGIKESRTVISAYPRNNNIFLRAFHWDFDQQRKLMEVWSLLILLTAIYIFCINNQMIHEGFHHNIDKNFLLLAITPVVMTFGLHYSSLSYLRFDVVRPVRKNSLFKEKGIVLLTHLVLNWFLFSLCYVILPAIFFQPSLLGIHKFWGLILLAGILAFVVFSWVILLSSLTRSLSIITQGFLLSVLIFMPFDLAPYFSGKDILINNLLYLALGIVLTRRAYKMWCQKEFD
ncbi:MAG: hypothetical protein KBD53_06590 [Candidatus Omnitrophica bacterium]|nr:hypothetical protein [Candidatus Omnitrophota bacterium]